MVSLNNESKLDLAEKHSESAGMGLSIPVGFIAAAFVFTDLKKSTAAGWWIFCSGIKKRIIGYNAINRALSMEMSRSASVLPR
jgi:hypothetical protein